MKKFVLVLISCLSLGACRGEKERVVIEATSPNGTSFQFMEVDAPDVTDITIAVAWPMSWAYEADKNPAVPYVAAETLLSGGTSELAPQDVLELFNDKNAEGSLWVRADFAMGQLSFPKEHTDEVVEIAAEMLANPQFSDEWAGRIKQGFIANQQKSRAETVNQMWSAARVAILGEQPLFHFLDLDDLDQIAQVTRDDLLEWHRDTIVRAGATIAVTGAASQEEAGRIVDMIMSRLPQGETRSTPTASADFTPRTILLHRPDAEKTTLGLLGQLPPHSDGGGFPDALIFRAFASTEQSPLFEAIRTELRASYGMEAGEALYDGDLRLMYIAGEVETEKLAQARDVVLQTYSSFMEAPDLSGLEEMRNTFAEAVARDMDYVDIAAYTIRQLAIDGRDPALALELSDRISALSEEDITVRLRQNFPLASDLIVVAASPNPDALPGACVITNIEEAANCP